MGVFNEVAELFGPNNRVAWQKLSREIGAEFVSLGALKGCRVESRFKVWTITLDTYDVGSEDRITFTRLRAPYVSADGSWFKIRRKGLLSNLGKLMGRQDVEIGDPELDRDFVIQGNDPNKLAYLFRSPRIRNLITAYPDFGSFLVTNDKDAFGVKLPDGVYGLYYEETGVIQDVEELKQLFVLFAETLNHLCHAGSAHEQDPGVRLGN